MQQHEILALLRIYDFITRARVLAVDYKIYFFIKICDDIISNLMQVKIIRDTVNTDSDNEKTDNAND